MGLRTQEPQFSRPASAGAAGAAAAAARRPMQGNVSGRHASPHRGSSVEFAEYRKYVPGDDLRRLDWRAYGRTDRLYVKEFEADTNLRCCLVVDTSGSMAFGSTGITKIEYAKRIAGGAGLSRDSAGRCRRPGVRCRERRHRDSAAAQPGPPDAAVRSAWSGSNPAATRSWCRAARVGRDDSRSGR